MPWAPQSELSAYNLTERLSPKSQTVQSLKTPPHTNIIENGVNSLGQAQLELQPLTEAKLSLNDTLTMLSPPVSNNLLSRSSDLPVSIINILGFVWAIGTLTLALYTLFINWNFRKKLKTKPMTSEHIINIFERAKATLNVKRDIPVLTTTQIKTPALYGIVQMKLLLPEDILERIDSEQLYYVFLHELVHFKRKDLWINGFMDLLLAIHWFNPLIWYALSRMRQDQELACDESTLSLIGTSNTKLYGLTLINLLQDSSITPRFAHVTELSATQSQIRKRFEQIKRFKPFSWKWGAICLLISLVVGTFTLTDAKGSNTSSLNEAAAIDIPLPVVNLSQKAEKQRQLQNQRDINSIIEKMKAKQSVNGVRIVNDNSYDFILMFRQFDESTGSFMGDITWLGWDAMSGVEGTISGSKLAFNETGYNEQGNPSISFVYSLSSFEQGKLKGQWSYNSQKGDIWIDIPQNN